MSAQDVYEVVNTYVPCARLAWPVGQAPKLPWAVYFAYTDMALMADDVRYEEATRWCVELYEEYPDPNLEQVLCLAIQKNFGPYEKSEAWVDSEGCYMFALYFTERN